MLFKRSSLPALHSKDPIRAELFSIERLEQHAESLARAQRITRQSSHGPTLLDRVKSNEIVLHYGYRNILQTMHAVRTITPAAEWLVDNFYVAEEQIREITEDLPPGYYRRLPKLAGGPLAGTPRVFGVAWAFIAHTDSRFDREWLRRFVLAYEKSDPLDIGELWALAISLRIVLVENLRRLTEHILDTKAARQDADTLADALLKQDPSPDAAASLRRFDSSDLPQAFAVQLLQRLRDKEGRVAATLQWLQARLTEQKTTAEEIVRLEHQDQTSMNTTVRNILTSMRLISAMDWAKFVEDVSIVDEILGTETGFRAMDFPTRDLYRHAIEELSRGSELSEIEVTRRAVRAAKSAVAGDENRVFPDIDRQSDPGYYLVSRGRPKFEKAIGFRVSWKHIFLRFYARWGTPVYLGSIVATTATLLAIPVYVSLHHGVAQGELLLLGLLALLPTSDLAVALVNRSVTDTLGPKALPKLDFADGIPDEFPTLVVMPIMLESRENIEDYLQRLEIHYLSNPDGHLQWALLSDWVDAPTETQAGDDDLLAIARDGARVLNERYPWVGSPTRSRFFIFHRKRVWNPREGVWMGWERKRGKLRELNHLLRGRNDTTFQVAGSAEIPAAIRYVLTLDSDTRMPRGAAYQLAGAMAHPLNRPHFDPTVGRVVEGYGIMQPRITPSLPFVGAGSLFQRIFSGPAGLDPYAFAVSDVYQDLFKEGSFIGKGIYDLDAFETALAHRVPDNTMLSHDLFEGLFARAALVTDIELFEEFPSHYEAAAARMHRWVRGDWQLLPWIFRRSGAQKRIPWIGRWKMVDNLRRSLVAPTLYLGLIGACALAPRAHCFWSALLLSTIFLPLIFPLVLAIPRRRKQIPQWTHWRSLATDAELAFSQALLAVIFLAHQTWTMTDAILRTLHRLTFSRMHFLEWKSAAQTRRIFHYELSGFYRRMASSVYLAAFALLVAELIGTAHALAIVSPLVVFWAAAPWVAHRISLAKKEPEARPLAAQDRDFLRLIARKTWRFFDTFVTEAHHSLPPDNFQEIPQPVVAHRTSPTNIGLYLLSVIAARDCGWIGVIETIERLEATLGTVTELKRYQGHLFNWYDTYDLRPLEPLYVSTVDSGNLAGHLWALGHACRQLSDQAILSDQLLSGLDDVMVLLTTASAGLAADRRAGTVTGAQWQDAMGALRASLRAVPVTPEEWRVTLEDLQTKATVLVDIARTLAAAHQDPSRDEILEWSELLSRQIRSHQRDWTALLPWLHAPLNQVPDLAEATTPALGHSVASDLVRRLATLCRRCDALVEEMRFGFLYDPTKKIFSIGFRVADQALDASYYDLLASEARLASFLAVAKGDVPALHWFRLTRSLCALGNGVALLSWSGSMFEYLMPTLVMHPPVGSLLDETCRRVVRRQMAYGAERGVPWGISECAYNAQDLEFTYQYTNFGVPGLGLKRGLSDDVVVAPYATALAAMVDPVAAATNFRRLARTGAEGRYGFYEALDYTPTRLPENSKVAVVQTYMAHHQGMTLVALTNVLREGTLRRHFHAEPRVRATELLLQERTPREVPLTHVHTQTGPSDVRSSVPVVLRRFNTPHDILPHTHLLSNGRYSVMITAAGSGYSCWRGLAVTRWREDVTRDAWGTYIFLRDTDSGEVWSAAYQPSAVESDSYEVDFSEDRAEIIRRDGSLLTTLEVVVSPEDDAEIRRVTIKNLGSHPRVLEVTSYAEIVLATQAADQAHPAFSNLFVQTEFVPEVKGLLCTRRPRLANESPIWAGHVVVVEGTTLGEVEYESDRARFLGRGRVVRTPMSVIDGHPLSNTAGAVLDPIVSLRRRVQVGPGETVRVAFTTLVAATRQDALGLADKYHDPAMFERTVTLAWTQAQIQQHHLGMEPSEAHLFQDIASRIIYSEAGLRPAPEVMERNQRGVTTLWSFGISGDLPIVLVRIDEEDDRDIVREVLRAHEYWQMKNLAVDLVILNERPPSYAQDLQTSLENLVRANPSTAQTTAQSEARAPQGSVFILRTDRLSAEERLLLQTAARITLLSRQGTLAQQMERLEDEPHGTIGPSAPRGATRTVSPETPQAAPELEFFNGLGGFSDDGREYQILLGTGQWTPAPWVNVISNPHFGFVASEAGSGYTWSGNSRENQVTPWSNDPVSDPPGEAFYIRDEDNGDVWTPTALPIREEAWPYTVQHGQGYTRYEHIAHGIQVGLLQYVPSADPVKISRLTLMNQSRRTRRLSVTAYVEWMLGTARATSAPYVVTESDAGTRALLARNPWNGEFAERVAFLDLGGKQRSWTADRTEFIGRNGCLAHPAAIDGGLTLSGRTGAGYDPCGALQTAFELRAGTRIEIVCVLGQGANRGEAMQLIGRYRKADLDGIFREIEGQWDVNLGAIQVYTPDRQMDLMLNRWLLYQTLSARLWARTGFYQAGGAYGFRDQLQDAMALTVSRRDLTREQILRAAARQFPEGDVQHWWHPPTGRGVRTRISDDLIWLPYVLSHYLEVTGDFTILDESIAFLEGPPLAPGEEDHYFQPTTSPQTATLFEHCARALDARLAVGEHGLPLMGSGDWNDGMNRVGIEGKGESIWLAWFLHATLWEFAKVAEIRGEAARAEKWRLHVGELKAAVERNGWDGEWYRRAYFDSGAMLGSATGSECRIDSIAQSWGVISGAADPARATRALAALDQHLVRRKDGLVLLLTPPFDKMTPSPGYIQGYLPGVRENGGQYTHAAIWAVLAFAALGDGDKAGELFALLNPIRHGSTRADIHRYKVEPYVVAGDIYAEAPHVGRGGWTWYTGSAGWMYRAGIEWILGCRLRQTSLWLDPCIPKAWPGFELSFRYHSSRYEVKVENPAHVCRGIQHAELDGRPIRGGVAIPLVDDGASHEIKIVLG